jgi:hypothetical protein
MSQKQEAVKTVVTAQDVLNAMAQAICDYKQWSPSKECLQVLLAQTGFETGWWKYMWNNNLGNYKAVAGGATDWCYFKCNEYLQASQIPAAWKTDPRVSITDKGTFQEVWFRPDHPACCFMSFETLAGGAAQYLKKLCERFSTPNDCGEKDAWYWATQGDATKFCHALKMHGYYTDDEAHYTKTVVSCMQHVQSLNLDYSNLPQPVGTITLPEIVIVGDPNAAPENDDGGGGGSPPEAA